MSNWITRPEAAKRLGISVCTLDRIVAEGKLPAYRMTGRASVRFREEDLDEYIEGCRVPVLTPAQRRRTAVVAPPVCRYKPGDLVV